MADHNNFRALSIGYLLSDYRIEGILGEGGFGITYLAIDTSLGKRVAIKEYFPREFSARDGTLTIRAAGGQEDRETFDWGRARFLEEARTLALFQHPNIVAVRRFFEANGTAYLVMDYCDGEPLDEIIKLRGPLERKQLDRILFPLLDGLEVIHQAHFLHRDIKPANIFIREDGSPLLLDFGAARQETGNHSRSVTSLATAGYAAIEQYSTRGKQGPWTDIYGLGATLYRAVTGEKPQESTERMLEDSMSRAVDKARGRYPASLLAAIDAAMAVRPEQRPQSVAKFRSLISAKSSAHPNKLNEQDSKSVPTPIVQGGLGATPVNLDKEYGQLNKHYLPFILSFLLLALILVAITWVRHQEEIEALNSSPPLSQIDRPQSPSGSPSLIGGDCKNCPEMVILLSGSFLMGASYNEETIEDLQNDLRGRSDPGRWISVPSFSVSKFEITRGQYREFVEATGRKSGGGCVIWTGAKWENDPSKNWLDVGYFQDDANPVTCVSWEDAKDYTIWLSQRSQKLYRLLTEVEWEYAARAGTNTRRFWGDNANQSCKYANGADKAAHFQVPGAYSWPIANCDDGYSFTAKVGSFQANDFGLHDVLGNAAEWVEDCWIENYNGAPIDQSARTRGDCNYRVVRGGSWQTSPSLMRSAYRGVATASRRHNAIGFRVASANF